LLALLQSPLHRRLSERVLVLRLTGRKSGRRYSFSVGYTQVGTTLLIPTESGWRHNLVGGAPVQVRLRGRERPGRAEVISDEPELRESYRVMLAANPHLRQILAMPLDPDGQPDAGAVARARAAGHVVVRVQLTNGA
jgi:hypothetical protein